jgi:hypothetical protein
MLTNDDHFHSRFLLIQRVWFGALALYLSMTLAVAAWERLAESAGDQTWLVPAVLVGSAGLLLAALAVRRVRRTLGRPSDPA